MTVSTQFVITAQTLAKVILSWHCDDDYVDSLQKKTVFNLYQCKKNYQFITQCKAPPMGDRLEAAVGLVGSEDPADSAF